MKRIKDLIKSETPFAIMQYVEYLKTSKDESQRKYELIYVDEYYRLSYSVLKREDVKFFKELDIFNIPIQNEDGTIYEFRNFKDYQKEIKDLFKGYESDARLIAKKYKKQ